MDKGVLTRATSKDDAPTPGYLYGEIARMTQHSYDTCSKVQDFLIARVKKKHHTIKYKALQVIKHICREGRVDFKREMQKHIPTIKECLQCRGVPDPLKGDEYYRRVRESAKECLDAIYDTDNTPGLSGMGMSARIQGVGANPNDNTGGSSGWSSKIWGGKHSNDSSLPPPPMAGPPIGGYNVAAPPSGAPYGYPSDPNQGSYGGPAPYGQQQPYQPEYPQQGSYGGPGGAANPAYGGAMPPGQYGGAPPPPFHDQKFSGIGNPMYQDPRADEKGFFKGLKEKVASKYSKPEKPTFGGGPPGSANPPDGWSFATNRGPTSGNYGPSPPSYNPEEPYRPTGYTGGGYRPGSHGQDPRESASTQLREKSYDGDRKKGRVGGAWTGTDAPSSHNGPTGMTQNSGHDSRSQSFGGNACDTRSYSRNSDYEYDETKRREPAQGSRSFPQSAILPGQTSGAQSDGSYERNLVTALCAPGGMRAIPPKDKMDAFLKSAITLDAEIVGPILEDCLSDDQWTVVSKALATIDALLKTDGCEEFEEYFAESSGEIEACAKSEKAAVRDRAAKILHHLGVSAAGPEASASSRELPNSKKKAHSGREQSARTAEVDLLGSFDDAPSAGSSGSLFSGLHTNASSQQPAQESLQPTPSAHDVSDMFGGLQLQSGTVSAAAATEPPQAPIAVSAPVPAAPAPPSSSNQTMVLDPLLEPVPIAPTMNQGYGAPMNMAMMNFNTPQQMAQMQQMQQMQYMQQMQQMQYMQMQQMQGMGGNPGSQVIGAAMTPTGYIAKTIQEPADSLTSDSGFGFMKKKDDSFNFVKDAMKNG
ncbi:unnamed protein product [Hyaloperonospora brassicae]|uniref:ENTH domain-containing protein n=1 Tax=Hyaloperonospora brassicae TaxID=162125 RepID=A0AAV0TVL8_HYABA|nr:unnamed protein product [Hyaloperonospora brassicae]